MEDTAAAAKVNKWECFLFCLTEGTLAMPPAAEQSLVCNTL